MFIPAGFAQVSYEFTGTTVPTGAAVTFGVEVLDDQTVFEVADGAAGAWDAFLADEFSENLTLSNIHVKMGPNDTGPIIDLGHAQSGAFIATAVSPAVALLVRKNTDLGGRHNRGRLYHPGWTETRVGADGVIPEASLTEAQGTFDNWYASLGEDHGIPMVLLHAERDKFGNPQELDPTAVTGVSVESTVGTQRRRQRR
jgi:hypothetical protein